VQQVHELATSTPHDNLDATFDLFKTMLHKHNVQRPPFSEAVFTLSDSQAIMTYVLSEYFQHFKLYKYVFTPTPIAAVHFQVEELPVPIPLPDPETKAGEGEAEETEEAAAAAGGADGSADAECADDGAGEPEAADDGIGEEPDITAFRAEVKTRLRLRQSDLTLKIEQGVTEGGKAP
jgi:hypothetical protein